MIEVEIEAIVGDRGDRRRAAGAIALRSRSASLPTAESAGGFLFGDSAFALCRRGGSAIPRRVRRRIPASPAWPRRGTERPTGTWALSSRSARTRPSAPGCPASRPALSRPVQLHEEALRPDRAIGIVGADAHPTLRLQPFELQGPGFAPGRPKRPRWLRLPPTHRRDSARSVASSPSLRHQDPHFEGKTAPA